MALTPQDVSRIADLARLELSDDEREAMLAQLNGFFDIVEQMRAVDTSGVEPLSTPLAAVQAVALRLRDDVVSESDQREPNQRSAPAVERRPVPGAEGDRMSAAAKALHELGVAELGRALAARQVSSVEVASHLLRRADAHAGLGAFLARDDDAALAQAGPPTSAARAATAAR